MRWFRGRAPPARRFAAQGCSYICFGPIIPVMFVRERSGAWLDIALYEQGGRVRCHRRYWPETDVGAALCCEAPRGRRSI
ncbi:protein of unknown function [Pseudomonas sp. JV551A1]|nr:protein of unknown function [Pseudomonas sp. JV551A1]